MYIKYFFLALLIIGCDSGTYGTSYGSDYIKCKELPSEYNKDNHGFIIPAIKEQTFSFKAINEEMSNNRKLTVVSNISKDSFDKWMNYANNDHSYHITYYKLPNFMKCSDLKLGFTKLTNRKNPIKYKSPSNKVCESINYANYPKYSGDNFYIISYRDIHSMMYPKCVINDYEDFDFDLIKNKIINGEELAIYHKRKKNIRDDNKDEETESFHYPLLGDFYIAPNEYKNIDCDNLNLGFTFKSNDSYKLSDSYASNNKTPRISSYYSDIHSTSCTLVEYYLGIIHPNKGDYTVWYTNKKQTLTLPQPYQ